MDAVLKFLVTLPIYVAVCAALAVAFVFADRRVRKYIRRPARCESCGAQVDLGLIARGHGKCPSCGHLQSAWQREQTDKEG